jgi:hypothetical protein
LVRKCAKSAVGPNENVVVLLIFFSPNGKRADRLSKKLKRNMKMVQGADAYMRESAFAAF